jgi:hypothetical protein
MFLDGLEALIGGCGRISRPQIFRAQAELFDLLRGVSGGTVSPFAESSIRVARRRPRVSSRFADMTQWMAAFR